MKILIAIICILFPLSAQPKVVERGVEFIYHGKANSVILAGDFNGWSLAADAMSNGGPGAEDSFFIVKNLKPGTYQYEFIVDGAWKLDEINPATTQNHDNSSTNSVFTLTENNIVEYRDYSSLSPTPMNDTYPHSGGTLFLNLIWHQHQPLYLDPQSDQLQGPWVRTHGTKDYYDMASILEKYPNVHYNVNLTSSLLFQLEKYYVDRLRPFVDVKKNRVDTAGYFARWKGKTDPWIDLALKPTKDFDDRDIGFPSV